MKIIIFMASLLALTAQAQTANEGAARLNHTANQRAAADNAYRTKQMPVEAARRSAAQAAAYARQASVYGNNAAHQAAEFATQAARHAQRAAEAVANPGAFFRRVVNEDEIVAFVAKAEAEAAQAAANAAQAAGQAEIDSGVAKLESQRDAALAQVNAKYASDIQDLESQISTLKLGAKNIDGQMSQSQRESAHLRAKQLFQPKDPWRMLDGKVCNAKEESWFVFTGKVLEVRPNGILIRGDFGPPLEAGFGKRDFFVENFPVQSYPLADGESIDRDMKLVAHMSEKASVYQFTNTTIDLRASTVRRLDYGTIVESPPPDLAQKWNTVVIADDGKSQLVKQLNDNGLEQISYETKLRHLNNDLDKERKAITAEYTVKINDVPNVIAKQARDMEVAKQNAVTDKVLKNNQDLADKGDAYGLLRMGERYRDGEGVPKDLAKAKDYLQKAAAAGSTKAADELKTLPSA